MPKIPNRSMSREERIRRIVAKDPARLQRKIILVPWERGLSFCVAWQLIWGHDRSQPDTFSVSG